MGAEIFRALVTSAITVSLSILIVAIARWPVRKLAGPSVAYALWLIVPASLIVSFLPSLDHELQLELVRPIAQMTQAQLYSEAAPTTAYVELTLLAIWALGFAGAMYIVVRQHRRLMRSLSDASGPMVVGILRPRIVLPADFHERYSSEEQALLLTHEQVHLRRRDTAANALATVITCLYWFNPLMHWALRRYRLDQEMSVDHAVVQGRNERSTYGAMLLNAQLAEQGRLSPFVSGWSPRHPLKERLEMLKIPAPDKTRRKIGATVVGALLLASTQLLWSAQTPAALADDSSLSMSADNSAVLTDGVVLLSGHVKLKAVDPAAPMQFSSDSIRRQEDGRMLLEGNVQFTLSRLVIKTDRATLEEPDSSIEMDQAYLIRLK